MLCVIFILSRFTENPPIWFLKMNAYFFRVVLSHVSSPQEFARLPSFVPGPIFGVAAGGQLHRSASGSSAAAADL
jgi:hypothetical protein